VHAVQSRAVQDTNGTTDTKATNSLVQEQLIQHFEQPTKSLQTSSAGSVGIKLMKSAAARVGPILFNLRQICSPGFGISKIGMAFTCHSLLFNRMDQAGTMHALQAERIYLNGGLPPPLIRVQVSSGKHQFQYE
jgi:hypothetical protein